MNGSHIGKNYHSMQNIAVFIVMGLLVGTNTCGGKHELLALELIVN